MRFFVLSLFLLCVSVMPCLANDVPQISFSQQVNIVVTVKRDPRVLEMKIRQENAKVILDLILDQNQDREEAKSIAHMAIMVAKSLSLDDKPADAKEPGKGLYEYQVTVSRPDGVVLVAAHKPQKKKTIQYENPAPVLHPVTRAGEVGR